MFIISFSCEDLYNQGNEISEITANADSVKAGLVVYLKCLATDENNDELSYNWQCSSGTLETFGDSAIWTAPLFEGVYFVTCTVSDKYGASSVKSKRIMVTPPSVVPVNGLEWELSDEGLVAGTNTSNPIIQVSLVLGWNVENTDYGWNITDQMKEMTGYHSLCNSGWRIVKIAMVPIQILKWGRR